MKLDCLPFSYPSIVGFDIETEWAYDNEPDPYRDQILLIQVAIPNDNTYILTKSFDKISPLLKDLAVTKVIHNASFDSKFILHQLGIEIKNVFDTLQAERILTAGKQESASLESVAQR